MMFLIMELNLFKLLNGNFQKIKLIKIFKKLMMIKILNLLQIKIKKLFKNN